MGKLTTHVLDTANGCPAAGMAVRLYRLQGDAPVLVKSITLNPVSYTHLTLPTIYSV